MDHKELLKKLGGPHAVQAKLAARNVEVKPVTVRAWALPGRSIPAKYWLEICAIAAAEGIGVSADDLAKAVSATC